MLAQKAVNIDDSDNSGASGASSANMDEAFLLIQQITANIVSYCQVAMTLGGKSITYQHEILHKYGFFYGS